MRVAQRRQHVSGAHCVTAQSFEGKITFLAVVHDVTEQKQTQDALRQAEEELRQLFASVSDYLWSGDVTPEGNLIYAITLRSR